MPEIIQGYRVDWDIHFFYNRLIHLRTLKEDAAEATEKGIQFGEQQRNWIIKDTRYYGIDLPPSVQKMEKERAHEIVHMLKSLVRAGNEVHFHTPMTKAMMAFIEV